MLDLSLPGIHNLQHVVVLDYGEPPTEAIASAAPT